MKTTDPNLSQELLESIEDDIQLRLDRFFDRLTSFVNKEARLIKEEEVRRVCVDYPLVDAHLIQQQVFNRLMRSAFEEENLHHYLTSWQKALTF